MITVLRAYVLMIFIAISSHALSSTQGISLDVSFNSNASVGISSPSFIYPHLVISPLQRQQRITLNVDNQPHVLRVANDSQPLEGFYRLEIQLKDDGPYRNAGFIRYSDDRVISVVSLPGTDKFEIVEKANDIRIRALPDIPSDPLAIESQSIFNAVASDGDGTITELAPTSVSSTHSTASANSIDVLIVFDPRLETAYINENGESFYDLITRLSLADGLTNSLLARSGFDITHRIVGIVPYTPESSDNFPTESSSFILSELASVPGIRMLKDRFQADMVHFIGAEDTGVCGRAYLGNTINSDNTHGFANFRLMAGYTRMICLGSGTYPHELGHNFGFSHDRITLGGGGIGGGSQLDFHIPYGYVEPTGEFFTNMAYTSSCRSRGDDVPCLDEAIYSNPDVNLGELPMGVPASQVEAADNAAAGRLSIPVVARADSFTRQQPLTQSIDDAGNITFSWPAVADATDYRLLPFSCATQDFISQSEMANADSVISNQITVSRNATLASRMCVYARFEDESLNTSFSAVALSDLNTFYDGVNTHFVYTDTNILDVFSAGDSFTFTLTLSDENTPNAAIQPAIALNSDGQTVGIDDAITEFNQWFEYTVTGSGTERLLTITPTVSVDAISDSWGMQDERNPFELPIRIVNTEFAGFAVYNTVWLDPQGALPPRPSFYYSNAKTFLELETVSGKLVVQNINESDTVTLEQISTALLNNFDYATAFEQDEYGSRMTVTFSGDVPVLDTLTPLLLRITSSHPDFADQIAEFDMRPAVIPPEITTVTGLQVIEGDAPSIQVQVSDPDDNLVLGDSLLSLVVGQNEVGEDIVETYPPSEFNSGTSIVVFNLLPLEIGDYLFTVDVFDNDNASVTYAGTLTVVANQAPIITNVMVNESAIVETRSFVLSADVEDPEEERITVLWEVIDNDTVVLNSPESSETEVAGLPPGVYEFRINATDERGLSSSETIQVSILENQAPQVTASATPNTPETGDAITLSATASDDDGEIVSVLWRQTSGTEVTLADTSALTLSLGTLEEGSYSFSVDVTDDIGAVSSDSVTFTVLAPAPPPPPPPPQTGGDDNDSGGGSGGGSLHLLWLALLSCGVYLRRRR